MRQNQWVFVCAFAVAIAASFVPQSAFAVPREARTTAVALPCDDYPACSGTHEVHVDHLNTPRLIANQSAQTAWRWDQEEPFGDNLPNENPSGLGAFEFALRFPGQYADKETNLFYNYFRDYDPTIGRYVQSDPLGLRAGLNVYGYVDAAPMSFVDPTGEILVPGIVVAVGIGVAIGYWGTGVAVSAVNLFDRSINASNVTGSRSDFAVECVRTGDPAACAAARDAEQQIVPATGEAVSSGADLVKETAAARIPAQAGGGYPAAAAASKSASRYPVFPKNQNNRGPYGPGYYRSNRGCPPGSCCRQ